MIDESKVNYVSDVTFHYLTCCSLCRSGYICWSIVRGTRSFDSSQSDRFKLTCLAILCNDTFPSNKQLSRAFGDLFSFSLDRSKSTPLVVKQFYEIAFDKKKNSMMVCDGVFWLFLFFSLLFPASSLTFTWVTYVSSSKNGINVNFHLD